MLQRRGKQHAAASRTQLSSAQVLNTSAIMLLEANHGLQNTEKEG